MLKSIILRKLRNSEFIQFFSNFFSILLKHRPAEIGIQEQLTPVVEDLEKIKTIHGNGKGSDISKELEDIDTRRDNCITGIQTVIEGYTYHYDDEMKEAAEILLSKINNYGPSIARQNYPTETSTLNSIAAAFTGEEKYMAALLKLTLTDWVVKMEEENVYFDQRYLDRVDESSKQSDDKIKELRKSTTENYYELRDHLNAHSTLKKEVYQTVMAELNGLIDEYNLLIKRRRSGKDEGEK